jgi:hypothetical protein
VANLNIVVNAHTLIVSPRQSRHKRGGLFSVPPIALNSLALSPTTMWKRTGSLRDTGWHIP